MEQNAELKIKSITLSAKIIRRDGTVEDLGVIAQSEAGATEAELVVEKIERQSPQGGEK